jgi:hypothetical protein
VRLLGADAIGSSVVIRLARLGPDCEGLAQALGVLGPGATLRHAARLAGLDRDRAMSAADTLHAVELISAESGLSFVHPIVSDAITAQLPPARRASLHADAARLLIEEHGSADLIAAHLLSSDPYGEVWAVDALRDATRKALARGAPEAAVAYLRRAIAEPPSESSRLDVLIELGRAEALLPEAQAFTSLRQALELAVDPEQRAMIALDLALALFGVLRNGNGTALLQEVLERHGDELAPDTIALLEQPLIAVGADELAAAPRTLARAKPYLDRVSRGERLDPRLLAALAGAMLGVGQSAERIATLADQSGSLFLPFHTATAILPWRGFALRFGRAG